MAAALEGIKTENLPAGSESNVEVSTIVTEMRANSKEWNAASASKRKELEALNTNLAAEAGQILGKNVVRDSKTGIWYIGSIGGDKLYDKYHTGGIVGGNSNIKDNEVLALLENEELVLDEPKKKAAYNLIDFGSYMAEKLNITNSDLSPLAAFSGGIFDSVKNVSTMPYGDATNITNGGTTCEISINVDSPISINGNVDKDVLASMGNTIGDATLSRLNEAFVRSGLSVKVKN